MAGSAIGRRLKSMMTGDTGAIAATAVVQSALRIAGSVILTRLLLPEAFGVVGIITSVAVTFGLLSDIGIIAYVVRHEEEATREFLDEIWTLRLIRSIILSSLVAGAAYPIASFIGKPELGWAIAVGGLTFLLDGADSLAFVTALCSRQVKKLNVIDISTQAFGLATSVILALVFRNYWAIIVNNLISQIIRSWLSYRWFPGHSRRWHFDTARARDLWHFSRFITGSTMLTLVITQTDKFVLAKLVPLQILGLYMIANNLAGAPTSLASSYAGRLLFPIFADIRRHSPENLSWQFYQLRMRVSLLYALGIGLLISCSPLIVCVLYNQTYRQVAGLLQILFISSFFAMNNYVTNEIMIARGEPSFTLYSNLVRLAFLVSAGLVTYKYFGVMGIIWTVGLIEGVAQAYGWIALSRRGILKVVPELQILGAGAAGIVVGYCLNIVGVAVLVWLRNVLVS